MSRLSDDDVLWMINSPRYDRDVRALAQELRERRANDRDLKAELDQARNEAAIAEVPTSATQAEQTLTSLRLAIDGHLPEVDDGRGDYWRTRIVQAGARIVALEAVLDAAGEQVDEFAVGTTERLREAVAAARRKP